MGTLHLFPGMARLPQPSDAGAEPVSAVGSGVPDSGTPTLSVHSSEKPLAPAATSFAPPPYKVSWSRALSHWEAQAPAILRTHQLARPSSRFEFRRSKVESMADFECALFEIHNLDPERREPFFDNAPKSVERTLLSLSIRAESTQRALQLNENPYADRFTATRLTFVDRVSADIAHRAIQAFLTAMRLHGAYVVDVIYR